MLDIPFCSGSVVQEINYYVAIEPLMSPVEFREKLLDQISDLDAYYMLVIGIVAFSLLLRFI